VGDLGQERRGRGRELHGWRHLGAEPPHPGPPRPPAHCGATAGFDPKTDIRYIWRREVNIIGANGWTREDLEALLVEVEHGSIKPIIDRVFPLAESAEAMRVLEDREFFGKIIICP